MGQAMSNEQYRFVLGAENCELGGDVAMEYITYRYGVGIVASDCCVELGRTENCIGMFTL